MGSCRKLEIFLSPTVSGRELGGQPKLNAAQVAQLRERAGKGEKKATLAREFGISWETVYQYLRAGAAAKARGGISPRSPPPR